MSVDVYTVHSTLLQVSSLLDDNLRNELVEEIAEEYEEIREEYYDSLTVHILIIIVIVYP